MKTRYFDLPTPRLFGHRGGSAEHPENTLPAFAAAVAAGVPYLELDVWATRDGHVVVHHDSNLRRTCGRFRRVCALDWETLRRLDAGWGFSPDGGGSFPFRGQGIGVPLLAEVLAAFPQARCNIEIKQNFPPIETQVVEVVRRSASAERVLLAAEKDGVMRRLRRLCGDIPTSLSRGEVANFLKWCQSGGKGTYRPQGVALQIPEIYGSIRLVTPETVQAARAAGLEVHVWTVNEAEDMRRLLEMGVDGLMSDKPELLVQVAVELAKKS